MTMGWRVRWLVLIFGILLIAVIGTLYALPEVVRLGAKARIQAITNRPVAIDAVDLHLLKGEITVRGLRLAERDGQAPFADFERLELRIHLPALLRGHLWIREAVLRNPTVRVVRLASDFNFSDLVQSSGTTTQARAVDVTVDRFALVGGTVTLEDRTLPEARTWTSENIQIEAHNVSTRREDGTAVGTTVMAGAPVRLEIENLRLHPIHLRATVTAQGVDLSLARLYFPPDAPVVLDQGRGSSTLTVALDAAGGLRASGTGQLEDVVLVRPGESEPIARLPKVTTQLTDFAYQDGRLQVGRLEVRSSASIRDPRAGRKASYQVSTLRASIADLTWPIAGPGRLDVQAAVPGGGTLAVSGTVQPPPAASQLRLRLANVDLAPWAQFLPVTAAVDGTAEADLRVDEPIGLGVPTRVRGAVAVNRVGVRSSGRELLGARRVEASGLEVQWPTRLAAKRLLVSEPRAMVERDPSGGFPVTSLLTRPAGASTASEPPSLRLEVQEVVVRGGAAAWRDQAVHPPVAVDFSRIEARVTGAAWPLGGPLGVRAAVGVPGEGEVRFAGRVGVEPLTADLRITATGLELEPYRAYVPATAHVSGRADLDLAVVLPPSSPEGASVRGSAALSRLDVRDQERTVVRIERAAATGLDVEWPRRAAVREITLQRPWILLERDEAGALPLPGLLVRDAAGASAGGKDRSVAGNGNGGAFSLPVAVGQLVVEDGGARVVDRSLSPPFAVDLQQLAVRLAGLSTARAGKPAQLELTGRAGAGSLLTLHGTIGPLGGPLRLEVSGDLRDFAMPRTNPYLLRQVGWQVRDGWLTTSIRGRVDGDALDAKTDIRLSRLQLARGGSADAAHTRIGLPLGTIVALMKDARGDITLSLPVGGRLRDPRFDLGDAIWSAVRTVAINAITLPVSWIGRVRVGADSRVERIEVDPIPFEPGAATLTPEGQEQVTRVAAFLAQLPEARLALTPVVSSRDLVELKRQAVDGAIDRATRDGGGPPAAAAGRLFQERLPGRTPPAGLDAIRAALVESQSLPADVAAGLATRRVEAVRDMVRKAGVDPARLRETQRGEEGAAGGGQIKVDLDTPGVAR
jgi:hypothetical protein